MMRKLNESSAGFFEVEEQDSAELYKRFAQTWNLVSEVYLNFREALAKQGLGTMGMAYRQLADGKGKEIYADRINLIGFNALSRAEETIFENLLVDGKARIFWDVSPGILNNRDDPAGKFQRIYQGRFNSDEVFTFSGHDDPPPVEVTSASGRLGQVTALSGALLKDQEWENTAVILADEALLMPLLFHLPLPSEKINITMGYPVKDHPLLSFLEQYTEFQRSLATSTSIPAGRMLSLLGNSYFRIIDPNFCHAAVQMIRKRKWDWVPVKDLRTMIQPEFSDLLDPVNGTEYVQRLNRLCDLIFYGIQNEESPLEKEVIYQVRKHLNQFLLVIRDFPLEELTLEFLWKLLKESFRQVRVPFSGEPVQGLQIMGFLESRALDYDQVMVLGLNEGILPASKQSSTYIPYALRKAFGLPTYEEQDAISSYHFKRLLSRSKRVHLFYNAELNFDGTGEKSRFILQQRYENPRVQKEVHAAATVSELPEVGDLSIRKTKEVLASLDRFKRSQMELFEKPSRLSPSALVTYISCSLRFYFRYVLRVHELEDPMEPADKRDFGNLLHTTIEGIYEDSLDKVLTTADFEQLSKPEFIHAKSIEAFKQVLPGQEVKNRNRFFIRINERLVREILNFDSREPELSIIALESEENEQFLETEQVTVLIGGVIDRMDEVTRRGSRVTRIVDYKTGKVSVKKRGKGSAEAYLEHYFRESRLKAGFQVYLYAWLQKRLWPDREIIASIYQLNQAGYGILDLWDGQPLDDEFMQVFGQQLSALINEVFDPEVPFQATENRDECLTCPYRDICLRN